jgi:PqqD family protein of HPr-rel-A system
MSHSWRLVNAPSLSIIDWDQDNAVFHGETGDTHLLSDLPTLVLRLLANHGPDLSEERLGRIAAEECDVVADAGWEAKVAAILRELAQLELLERGTA